MRIGESNYEVPQSQTCQWCLYNYTKKGRPSTETILYEEHKELELLIVTSIMYIIKKLELNAYSGK